MSSRVFSTISEFGSSSSRPSKRLRVASRTSTSRKSNTLSDLPVDVLSSIIALLPRRTHFSLSTTSTVFASAVRNIHHRSLRRIDLIPGVAFDAPPPVLSLSKSVLAEPHLITLAGNALKEVRLHSAVSQDALRAVLERVMTQCPNLESLALTDCGALAPKQAKALCSRLQNLTRLDINACQPVIFESLSEATSLQSLSAHNISPAALSALQVYLEGLSTRGASLAELSVHVRADAGENNHKKIINNFLQMLRKNAPKHFPVSRKITLSIRGGGRYASAFSTAAKKALAAGKPVLPANVILEFESQLDNAILFPSPDSGMIKPVRTKICLDEVVRAFEKGITTELAAWMPCAYTIVLPTRFWTGRYARLSHQDKDKFMELLSGSSAHTLELRYSINSIRFCGTPYPHIPTFSLMADICKHMPLLRTLRISREVVEHVGCTDTVDALLNALPGGLRTVHLTEPDRVHDRCNRFVANLSEFLARLDGVPALRAVYVENPCERYLCDSDVARIALMKAVRELRCFEKRRPEVNISTARAVLETWEIDNREVPTELVCRYLG